MLLQTDTFAGAWAQPKGHYYVKMNYINSTANSIFGINFPANFDNSSIYFYGEYGLFDKFTVIASMPTFKRSISENNLIRGETNGYFAGDLEVQAKYQFIDRPIVTTALVGAKIPVSYKIYDIPPLGNGETDWDAKLQLGVSFYPIPLYASGDIGYRLRGGEFIDELNYTFELGFTIKQKFLPRFMTTGIKSVEDAEGGLSTLVGFPLAQDQFRFGGGVIFIWNQNIELDITYLKTTSGRNIPNFDETFVGIAFKK